MTCIEYVNELKKQGWKIASLEGNILTLHKNNQLIKIDLRFHAQNQPPREFVTDGWTNPQNVGADDSVYATISIAKGAISLALTVFNFGFGIPLNATILGITAKINAKASAASSLNLAYAGGVQLGNWNGVTWSGINNANQVEGTLWTTSDVDYICGSASDLWNNAWTPAQFNDSTFGMQTKVKNNNTSYARTASIDYIELTITYSLPFAAQIIIF